MGRLALPNALHAWGSVSENGEVSIMVVKGSQLVQEVSSLAAMLSCKPISRATTVEVSGNDAYLGPHAQACTRHRTAPTASAALGRHGWFQRLCCCTACLMCVVTS